MRPIPRCYKVALILALTERVAGGSKHHQLHLTADCEAFYKSD